MLKRSVRAPIDKSIALGAWNQVNQSNALFQLKAAKLIVTVSDLTMARSRATVLIWRNDLSLGKILDDAIRWLA
ncbi:MAG: hypothetical protein CV081_04715 [Nitrospira sp. LK265]|nr:hypothetical protein [Nitrospira sp. LK265]